jgi:hypothetical protein
VITIKLGQGLKSTPGSAAIAAFEGLVQVPEQGFDFSQGGLVGLREPGPEPL